MLSPILADFNSDAKLDLAVLDQYSNNVRLSLGNGNGTFTSVQTVGTGGIGYPVATADLNGARTTTTSSPRSTIRPG